MTLNVLTLTALTIMECLNVEKKLYIYFFSKILNNDSNPVNVSNCFKNRRNVQGPFSRVHYIRRWTSLICGTLLR